MTNKILQFANDNIALTPEAKDDIIKNASIAYGNFLDALGINWQDDPNSSDTPKRVAKSFVNDLIAGCYTPQPNITTFNNLAKYDGIVFNGNIEIKSICSHHHLPFIGSAHVAYIPAADGSIIGLSKLNRVVEYFARRPQVQESLTMQIHNFLNDIIDDNAGIAVMIEANHMCSCLRGVKHKSTMKTSKLSGAFLTNDDTRKEFYDSVTTLNK